MNKHASPDTEPVDTPLPDPNSGKYAIFKAEDFGWVLRDNTVKPKTDYPFATRGNALAGIDHLTDGFSLIGSPARRNAYGAPLEGLEVFA